MVDTNLCKLQTKNNYNFDIEFMFKFFNRPKLPSYRLAPDYETAVQRKYSQGDYYNQNPNLIPTAAISHQDINLQQVKLYFQLIFT